MKFLKLLVVPAVLLLSLTTAVPAFAHNVIKATITTSCENGQICVTLTGTTTEDTDKRIVLLQLFNGDTKVGDASLTVPAFDASHPKFTAKACFPAQTSASSTSFTIKVVNVVDENGHDSDLTVADENDKIIFQFDSDHRQPVVLFTNVQNCATPSTPTPTPTATASPVAALANTGGLDFRFPLIGLTILVVGLALLVINASRGRSTPTK